MEITRENTVAEIVSKNLGSDHVFSKYKIDFCCGGGVTLEVACKEIGLDFETLKVEIETINSKIIGEYSLNDADIYSLIEQSKSEYHNYIYLTIPQLIPLAAKVADVHGAHNSELVEINTLFIAIEIVLNEMLKNSENSLFPVIEEILNLNNVSADISTSQVEKLEKAIANNKTAQLLIGDTFKEISNLSSHYKVPEDGCSSYKFLYEKLHELDHQLQKYMHLYKNVLIPKVLKVID